MIGDLPTWAASYMRWANGRMFGSLRGLNEVPAEAVTLAAHIVTTERLYLSRMQGDDPFPQDFWLPLTRDEAERQSEDTFRALSAFISDRTDEDWQEAVRYRTSGGTYYETPLIQMLTHLVIHGEHHRGQVARLVREAGGTPALTDFIAFVRERDPGQGSA